MACGGAGGFWLLAKEAAEGEMGFGGVFPAFVLGGGTPVWVVGLLRGLTELTCRGFFPRQVPLVVGKSHDKWGDTVWKRRDTPRWVSTVDGEYLKASFVYSR
ncbi:hypothetical protein D5S17_30925 [Pseudonocardiaceae bacterium YIM PH 21723]|nr:hypothetical protein D5S17_30925 [Pseudonocardiaceae bacterium YIM PH 21723]